MRKPFPYTSSSRSGYREQQSEFYYTYTYCTVGLIPYSNGGRFYPELDQPTYEYPNKHYSDIGFFGKIDEVAYPFFRCKEYRRYYATYRRSWTYTIIYDRDNLVHNVLLFQFLCFCFYYGLLQSDHIIGFSSR